MSDLISFLVGIGLLLLTISFVIIIIHLANSSQRKCPQCNSNLKITQSFRVDEETEKRIKAFSDPSVMLSLGIFELIVGSISILGLILWVVSDINSGCALRDLSVVCQGGTVTSTTGIGIYLFLFSFGVYLLLDSIARIITSIASRGKEITSHLTCPKCKAEWDEKIIAGSKKDQPDGIEINQPTIVPPLSFIIIVHVISILFLPILLFLVFWNTDHKTAAQVALIFCIVSFLFYFLAGGLEWSQGNHPVK